MRQVLGAAISLLGLALATLLGLRIWGISVLSGATLLRSGATLAIVAGALVGVLVVRFTFFRNPATGYDTRAGNRAHPKRAATPET